jgi:hypothetical protein
MSIIWISDAQLMSCSHQINLFSLHHRGLFICLHHPQMKALLQPVQVLLTFSFLSTQTSTNQNHLATFCSASSFCNTSSTNQFQQQTLPTITTHEVAQDATQGGR